MSRIYRQLFLCMGAVSGMLFLLSTAEAEPWISTRYAQNCAGCHAPGRKNLPVAERRCTLSCQGCHVSPSGGGLRSYYGKWNEDRWLRSFSAQVLGGGQSPTAPVNLQKYGPKKKNEYSKGKKTPKGGFDLVELKAIPPDSKEIVFDRRDGLEKITSSDRQEFEYQIPRGDPYRQMDLSKIDAGADLRWQWRRGTISAKASDAEGNTIETDPQDYWSSFPMQVETQFGWRPFHRKLRFVYEVKAQRGPGKNNPDDLAISSQRRSLYAMVDDLPYNLYVQSGYYRPLFGYYTPDHYFLPQLMMGEAFSAKGVSGIKPYNQQFLTHSIGGSPNLPYANIHYIAREISSQRPISGVAANLGVRFVTKGISLNYSIWKLSDSTVPDNSREYLFQSLFGSIQIGKLTYSLDLTSLERNDPLLDLRRGGVYSMDAYYQLFRAIYANAQYAYANSAIDLTVGNTMQMRFGLRSFLTAGTDFTVHYEVEQETKRSPDGAESIANRSGLVGQIHLFM